MGTAKNISKPFALILGGSKGLGLATAKKLAAEKYPLIILHRDLAIDLEQVEIAFEEIREIAPAFYSFQTDALNPLRRKEQIEKIKTLLGSSGRVGVVIHSIAKGNLKRMLPEGSEKSLSAEDLRITADAMAFSLYQWVQELNLAGTLASDTRVIAFTSEGSSRVLPSYGAVGVAKAALQALVRQMAVEFAPVGIKVNCIQAGVTLTDSFHKIPGSDKLAAYSLKRNPNNRLTQPEDVANATYLLCRPEASWITGNILIADGGEHLI
ncbi:SDR family oxidoreductase [Robiginitalea sp. IMCC44478]|uniref:SDR family oxidoreductase n=1 Tax=Robiginitalea sp. IMCC44478 TaxID=3459122 RepID=UPI0040427406